MKEKLEITRMENHVFWNRVQACLVLKLLCEGLCVQCHTARHRMADFLSSLSLVTPGCEYGNAVPRECTDLPPKDEPCTSQQRQLCCGSCFTSDNLASGSGKTWRPSFFVALLAVALDLAISRCHTTELTAEQPMIKFWATTPGASAR
ncbi:hypothetical protein C0Q70_04910 [Pomacea canaliculata]|uniref:Uncharacterized protein n=1 Tax=Pomacea canaliculata TaxID=400727 RepID=A0A2T7PJT5_POMCA|nr:hypothetical protein C0Q70_04910 [Pomacea canaliculata]